MRRGFQAFRRGAVDALLENMHPDVVLHEPVEIPDSATYHGHDGFRTSLARAFDPWDVEVGDAEFTSVGEKVLVGFPFTAVGKGSGVRVEGWRYDVYTLRRGKVAEVHMYLEKAQALEAVRLSE